MATVKATWTSANRTDALEHSGGVVIDGMVTRTR